MRRFIQHLIILCAAIQAESNNWKGTHPERPSDWHEPSNWSSGSVPRLSDGSDVVIPAGLDNYPILKGHAEVDLTLIVDSKARLNLNGHIISIARESQIDFDQIGTKQEDAGFYLHEGGFLDASEGIPKIIIGRGTLSIKGNIRGRPALVANSNHAPVILNLGGAAIRSLTLTSSIFPYRVAVNESFQVGALELQGGHLLIQKGQVLDINGDLELSARRVPSALTLLGDINLHGSIKGQGSLRHVQASDGWLRMVGKGGQVIESVGILPHLMISRASGKVRVNGNLRCTGLKVQTGNVLDLSKGSKLIFGLTTPEWRFDPKDKLIIKTYQPSRSSRDLFSNHGTILGTPEVPFRILVAEQNRLFQIEGKYFYPAEKVAPKTTLSLETQSPVVGSLSAQAAGSRLQIKDGRLLLDGKPVTDKEEDPDAELEDEVGLGEDEARPEKAQITNLSMKEVKPESVENLSMDFDLANVSGHNIARFASRICSYPSIGMSIRNAVDGDEATAVSFRTGVGRGGSYEFAFDEPVAISRVRFLQGGLFAIQYFLYADTTNDGKYDKALVYAADGAPNAWQELSFETTPLYRLKLRAFQGQRGWEKSYPDIREIEIYSDEETYQRLAKDQRPESKIPESTPWIEFGEVVKLQLPEPTAATQILKSVMVDLWMAGIHENQLPKAHLRAHAPFQKLLEGVKELGADTMTLFIEADPKAFWPSKNFKSITNPDYYKKIEEAGLPQVGEKLTDENEKLDEFDDEVQEDVEQPEKPRPEIKVPIGRDLLREFTEGAHEQGLKVFVLFRPDIYETYIGPKGQDAYELLCEEVATRGVDGVYLMPDEDTFGLANPRGAKLPEDHPSRAEFRKRWGPDADLPNGWEQSVNYRRHVLSNYERAGEALKRRQAIVKKINPKCITLLNIGSGAVSGNNRMTYGLAYDLIGHLSGVDYMGTDYQPQETRRFVAASKTRQATVMDGVGIDGTLGVISGIFQGASIINHYRYNYIELWKRTDSIKSGLKFIQSLERWGIRRARPPRSIALLTSRASEDWWDNLNGTYWLGWNPKAKQGFWSSRFINEFLLRNGYSFDLYYLDHVEQVREAAKYDLLILPFPYSVSKEVAGLLAQARSSGKKFLIGQKQGEVDELGVVHEGPALQNLIKTGQANGDVVCLEENWVDAETDPKFISRLRANIDKLLGDRKPMLFLSHGSNVEAHLLEIDSRTKFIALLNWGAEASVEVGVHMPEGNYEMIGVSMQKPEEFRTSVIGKQKSVSTDFLKRFAVKLPKHDVLALKVQQR